METLRAEPDPDPPKTLLPQHPTSSPSPSPRRKTLTLDLVWAKTGKGQPWWPARVLANCDGRLQVSRFGDGHVGTSSCHVSQVKPFFIPNIADMARQTRSKAFHSSFEEALRFASKYLQSELTCDCVPLEAKPLNPRREFEIGTCNLTNLEFINHIRDAALSVSAVDLEECVRLKSWVFALGQGFCNGEVGFNQRKLMGDLVNNSDLNLDKCAKDDEEKLLGECSMGFVMDDSTGLGENLMNSDMNRGCKTRKNKRGSESDKGLEREKEEQEETGSGKRERKKSKYLSPPYTEVVGFTSHKQSEEKKLDEREIGERDGEGVEKGNLVDSDAFSVWEIFNDFLLTGMNPLHLKRKKSAKVFRAFFEKYRDSMFVEGREHENYGKHNCEYNNTKEKIKIKLDPDNESVLGSGSSLESCITPEIVTRVDEELENVKGKEKSDNGSHQPKKRGRKRKEEKHLVSSAPNVPNVEKSEQKERTVLNFAKGSYQFLEEARAEMLKTSYPESSGNKPIGIVEQSQEQGPLKNCNTGNSDGKKRGRPKKKVAEAHYPNPAVLLLDFSKPNAGSNLPSRDQLLSTFGKFGVLVETQSDVHRDTHTARVVFARSADAEAAYNSSDNLGPFGPPFASCRLHYLPPITVNPPTPPPAQQVLTSPQHLLLAQQQLSANKPQLSDIRKNLEKMISSLTSGPGLPVKGEGSDGIQPEMRGRLVGEMQGLLMKVEKRLGSSTGATSSALPALAPPP